ncbi:hypothetical protein AgCh_023486 [Apium graveolens]
MRGSKLIRLKQIVDAALTESSKNGFSLVVLNCAKHCYSVNNSLGVYKVHQDTKDQTPPVSTGQPAGGYLLPYLMDTEHVTTFVADIFESMQRAGARDPSVIPSICRVSAALQYPADKIRNCCAKLEECGGGLIKDLKTKLAGYRRDMKGLRSRRDSVGVREWIEKDGAIQELITQYFGDIFTSADTGDDLSERLSFKQISEDQKQFLIMPITDLEVKEALFAMHPDKTPGLGGMMRQYENNGLIHGCRIVRGAPPMSHLLFVDDAYFFFKASIAEARSMKTILQKYESCSRKLINYQKSNIIFSPNTKIADRTTVCDILQVQEVEKPGKYLGMPMSMGRIKQDVFAFLKDKVQQKIKGWVVKNISRSGKLTLLSSATQMLPTFWMNLFLIHAGICEDIERKMDGFLWGKGVAGKGIRWMGWDKMCVPKHHGGLGVKYLRKFNLAMLAKQGWRLLQESNPFVSKIIKAKYYPNTMFLQAKLGSNPSYVWRSLMEAMTVIKAGARRRIGNGTDTAVWHVPWLPSDANGYVTTLMPEYLQNSTVNGLMNEDDTTWDMDVIKDILNNRDAGLVERIPISLYDRRDSWFWCLEDTSIFTVKSCYKWLQGVLDSEYRWFWRKLWNLKLPGKVLHFVWRVCKGCLPTTSALLIKRVVEHGQCPWCRHSSETDSHVLFTCDFARSVWYSAGLQHIIQASPQETAAMIFLRIFEHCNREQMAFIAMISYSIWHRRNKWTWDEINGSVFGVKAATMHLLADWRAAQLSLLHSHGQGDIGDSIWRRPPEGWSKINTDAAVFRTGQFGLGIILRDAPGLFVGAKCCKMSERWTPSEAQALAMKEALLWVISRWLDHCIIETDFKLLVDACNGGPAETYFEPTPESLTRQVVGGGDMKDGDQALMVYKLPSGKESMAASKRPIKSDSSPEKMTEDITVAPPASNQPLDPRPITTGVELSKDEGTIFEDANVFSDTDSDVDSDAKSDTDGCNHHEETINNLKKVKEELEEELKYLKEKVEAQVELVEEVVALKLEFARGVGKHILFVLLIKEVAKRGGLLPNIKHI